MLFDFFHVCIETLRLYSDCFHGHELFYCSSIEDNILKLQTY